MATHPILGFQTIPDSSGNVFPAPLDQEITFTNAKKCFGIVFNDPAANLVLHGGFVVPSDFSSTPKIRATMIIDGAPAASAIAGLGFRQNQIADSETVDVAFETDELWQKTIDSGAGYANEDLLVMLSDALGGTFAAGDWVPFEFFRDTSIDTFAGKLILVGLEFDYTAA